ncbi:MAG: type II toxin-antitoxin system VapC family toxin [Candidatus Micrarchaeia archaeon]
MEVLDTDLLVALLRGSEDARLAVERLETEGETAATAITAFELLFGARKSGRPDNLQAAQRLLHALPVLEFTNAAAQKTAELAFELHQKREVLEIRDLLIAGIVEANHATLVTRNIKHFSRIPKLGIQSW